MDRSLTWKDAPWLILDTETTGLEDAAIVELGAVIMARGEVLEYRASLFNPGKPIEPKASEITGITDDMVAGRPRIIDVSPRTGRTPAQGLDALASRHDCRALVGYNLISFDLPILRRELGPDFDQLESSIGPTIDPLVVVRTPQVGKWWKGHGRHKLTAVAERFGLDHAEPNMGSKAHRAAWDCVLAGRVLWHLRDELPDDEEEVRSFMAEVGARQRAELDAYWKSKEASQ